MRFRRVKYSKNYYRAKILHHVFLRSFLTRAQMLDEMGIYCTDAPDRLLRRYELNKEPISIDLFNRILQIAAFYQIDVLLFDLRRASEEEVTAINPCPR